MENPFVGDATPESRQNKVRFGVRSRTNLKPWWLAWFRSAVSAQDTAFRWVMNRTFWVVAAALCYFDPDISAFCLLTFPAGMAADRIDRRRILKVINLLLAGASGLLTIFTLLHRITPSSFGFRVYPCLRIYHRTGRRPDAELVEEKYWPRSALQWCPVESTGIAGPATAGSDPHWDKRRFRRRPPVFCFSVDGSSVSILRNVRLERDGKPVRLLKELINV
jgi:hypothetical protein